MIQTRIPVRIEWYTANHCAGMTSLSLDCPEKTRCPVALPEGPALCWYMGESASSSGPIEASKNRIVNSYLHFPFFLCYFVSLLLVVMVCSHYMYITRTEFLLGHRAVFLPT